MPRRIAVSARHLAICVAAFATVTSVAGCSGEEAVSSVPAAADTAHTAEASASGETQSPVEDARAQEVFTALEQSGVRRQSPATTLQLVRGICTQLRAGASHSEILDNLQSVTNVFARDTGGGLNGHEIAQIYVDAAQVHYCE